MNNIFTSLKRKSHLARQLIKQRDWEGVGHKLRRNLGPAVAPCVEAFQLGRDVIAYNYRQYTYDGIDSKFDTSFSLNSLGQEKKQKKNVIWIMLDALRQDAFEAYLKQGGLTDLIPDSVYFSRAFAQGSWTYPSVFSFLTGRYPFNCGVSKLTRNNGNLFSVCSDFDDSCPTVFSILRQQGYQVASILDGWGFTVRTTAGQSHREDEYFEKNWGWIYGQGRRYLTLSELREASTSYIKDAASQGPFMLFVRSLYTHSPYRDIFKSADYVNTLSRRGWAFRIIEGFVRGLHDFEKNYLKEILIALTEAGQIDNTIIIISSDHGEMFWNLENDLLAGHHIEEEMWRHQLEPYNALIKVPVMIWGTKMQGLYSDCFRLIDIVPTLVDELGLDSNPDEFDGVSARHLVNRPIYADSAGYGFGGIAFQSESQKILMSRRLGATRYDISLGDYEHLDLRQPATAKDVEELTKFIERTSRYPHIISADEDSDEEVLLRRLQALGYVD